MTDVAEVVHSDSPPAVRSDEERYFAPTSPEPVVDRRPPTRQRAHDLAQLLRGLVAGVILAGLVALGIDNRQSIEVGYVFGDGDARLWVLLAIAAVGGMLFGWLVAFRSHRTT